LHVEQTSTAAVRRLHARDPQVVTWVLSDVEVRSALARLGREGAMKTDDLQQAVARVESFWTTLHVVSLVDPVKARAKRLVAVHPLRAADAMQLGAALTAALDDPLALDFVSLDERLREAARREGFTVLP
jgi:hypothetical protein